MWIEQTARTHGVTDDDMRHALTHRLHVSELPTDDDSERVLILGPDRAGNPLELVALLVDDGAVVIHAMALRARYRSLLERKPQR
ncbi:MAG: hypothetical protein ACR2MN_04425 [Acidimicrobiales bacterium]